jgi:hypothetical protein
MADVTTPSTQDQRLLWARIHPSNLQVSEGYGTIHDEFIAGLKMSFCDHGADFIVVRDRRQRFQGEAAAFGEANGWLSSELIEHDEQSSELRYRLTALGRAEFGLEPPNGSK